jgi:hypothetical protein
MSGVGSGLADLSGSVSSAGGASSAGLFLFSQKILGPSLDGFAEFGGGSAAVWPARDVLQKAPQIGSGLLLVKQSYAMAAAALAPGGVPAVRVSSSPQRSFPARPTPAPRPPAMMANVCVVIRRHFPVVVVAVLVLMDTFACSVMFPAAAPPPPPCNKPMMMPNGDELKKSSYETNTDADPARPRTWWRRVSFRAAAR